MTSRTRHYIDLEDLLGLRFECKNCSTSIDVGVSHLAGLPLKCPNCDQSWMVQPRGDLPGTPAYSLITDFVSTYKAMTKAIEGEFAASKFSLSLEITAPAIAKST